jgi:hypothetical protein
MIRQLLICGETTALSTCLSCSHARRCFVVIYHIRIESLHFFDRRSFCMSFLPGICVFCEVFTLLVKKMYFLGVFYIIIALLTVYLNNKNDPSMQQDAEI